MSQRRVHRYNCLEIFHTSRATYGDVGICQHGDIFYCIGNLAGSICYPRGIWKKVTKYRNPFLYWQATRAIERWKRCTPL